MELGDKVKNPWSFTSMSFKGVVDKPITAFLQAVKPVTRIRAVPV
jgi:hypothetical protein